MSPEISQDTLAKMEMDLPAAVALLPSSLSFDVIGYGCTSAATVIGPARVHEIIQADRPEALVTDPLSAVIAACHHLGARRIGFLTPYAPDVSALMQKRLEDAGLEIAAFGSFEESDDRVVARIREVDTLAAIEALSQQAECDLFFASCTNLRVLGILQEAERRVGKPVISSNIAMAWHMLRLAGQTQAHEGRGMLLGS
jgi:maleate isomerase